MLIYHQLYSFYSRDTVRDSGIQGTQLEIQGYRGYSQKYRDTEDTVRDTRDTGDTVRDTRDTGDTVRDTRDTGDTDRDTRDTLRDIYRGFTQSYMRFS